ncbi:BA14K family protein [Acuticoccus yangtzensis]|uniref:BA14K family protein n=1 Tax=Acuticoccus yangtzensis TaxID=1443441 RepID=UPI000949A3CD|nr:BA14K family protein [Acuticoccus yangtzensis]ORE91548.1 hypothetical protein ATO13_19965 [Stappia sp. 22II-S9-Z10]
MRALYHLIAVGAGMAALASSAGAADLNHYTGKYGSRPMYFGSNEPWSVMKERPPRKGDWYFTAPVTPTVNMLVPMNQRQIRSWTPEWYAYCAARWPSFNPKTGFVSTPDGPRACF